MQINGFENKYHSDFHHVTDCNHNQSVRKKESDGAADDSAAVTSFQAQQMVQQEVQPVFSLSAWVKNVLAIGKKGLQTIWLGGNKSEADVSKQDKNTEDEKEEIVVKAEEENLVEQALADIDGNVQELLESGSVLYHPQVAAAATAVMPEQRVQNNPYFSAVEEVGRQKQSLWEKIKVKFQEIAGYLTRQFSGGNSFQAKQEQAKEDLRRRNRYHGVDLEVKGALTDDSHLMDSYDNKGEYRKLSARK